MSSIHKVQQGEYLASIAALYGVAALAIWNDPDNAQLKQKRQNPNVLFPGDKLTIPDKEPKIETVVTGQLWRFRLNSETLLLRILLKDNDNKPIANMDCILAIEGKAFNLKTDGNGKLEQEIPATARAGLLSFKDISVDLEIGYLDPVEEVSGQFARLNNLGYYAGDLEKFSEEQFLSAVEEFQCDHKLSVDGKCGPNTQQKLREVHGC